VTRGAQIKNAEALVRQSHRPIYVNAGIIRSTMSQTGSHGSDPIPLDRSLISVDLSGYATHLFNV